MDISTPPQCDVQPAADTTTDNRNGSEKRIANLRQFQRGISGNPGGRPKTNPEVKSLAIKNSRAAMERIIELMDNPDPRVAIMAAKEVLDRAYGKVKQAEDENSDKRSVTINIVKYDYPEADAGSHATKQLATPTVSVRTLALS